MYRKNFRHSERGKSHHQFISDSTPKKKIKIVRSREDFLADVVEHAGEMYHQLYVVDASQPYPSFLYNKKRVEFVTPKKHTVANMSNLLAKLIIFLNTHYIFGNEKDRDILLSNYDAGNSVEPRTIILSTPFYWAEKYPKSNDGYSYSYRPLPGLNYKYTLGPFELYTNFEGAPTSRTTLKLPSRWCKITLASGEVVMRRRAFIILDPMLLKLATYPGEPTVDVMDLLRKDEESQQCRDRLEVKFKVFCYFHYSNAEVKESIARQWNHLMHAMNGNIRGNTEHRDLHGGHDCPYPGRSRCLVLPIADTAVLDALRNGYGKLPAEAEISDTLRTIGISYDQATIAMSLTDLYNQLDYVPMTSEQRGWLKDHHYMDGCEDIAHLVEEFMVTVERGDFCATIVPRPQLTRNRTPHTDVQVASELIKVTKQGGNAFQHPWYRELDGILSLANPDLLTAQHSERQRAVYLNQLLSGQIDVELLPLEPSVRNDLRSQIKAYHDRIEEEERKARVLGQSKVVSRTILNSDHDACGLSSRLLRNGSAHSVSYQLYESYSVDVATDDRHPKFKHIPCMNPDKAVFSHVVASYKSYHSYDNLLMRFVMFVLYSIGLTSTWYSVDNTIRTFEISQDLLSLALSGAVSLPHSYTAHVSHFQDTSKFLVFPTEYPLSIYNDTFEVYLADVRLNDSAFLDPTAITDFLDWSAMDLNLSAYPLRNLTNAVSRSKLSSVMLSLVPALVLLPIVYSLVLLNLSSPAQTTPNPPFSKPGLDTDLVIPQDNSTLTLLAVYASMYAVSVVSILLPSEQTKIYPFSVGLLDLITLFVGVLNFKKSMISTLLVVIPLLTTLAHSTSKCSQSRSSTPLSNMLVESILAPMCRNVFISLLLIGLKKLFTRHLSSSNMFLHMTDLSSWKELWENMTSFTKLISLLLSHISHDISLISLKWKYIVICVLMLLAIWVLICQLNLDLTSFLPRLPALINAMPKIFLLALMLQGCQARCLHPLAMDSLTFFSTPLSLNYAESRSTLESWKEMMASLGSENVTSPSYPLKKCTVNWDFFSNSSSIMNFPNLVSVELCILQVPDPSFGTLEPCYQNLFGMLAYVSPADLDSLSSRDQNFYLAYVNVLDVLWSLQLSCELPEHLLRFQTEVLVHQLNLMLEILANQRLQDLLSPLGLAHNLRIHQDLSISMSIMQQSSTRSLINLEYGQHLALLRELSMLNCSEFHPVNKRRLNSAIYLAAYQRRLLEYFGGLTLYPVSSMNDTCLNCLNKTLVMYPTSLFVEHSRLAISALSPNITRLLSSLKTLLVQGGYSWMYVVQDVYKLNYTAVVQDLNMMFTANNDLQQVWFDYTNRLLYDSTTENFLLGTILTHIVATKNLRFTEDSISGTTVVNGIIKFNSTWSFQINWDYVDRLKMLFFN